MTAVEAQWSPAKRLILGDDPPLRIYSDVSVWFQKIEVFRSEENRRMIAHDPTPEDLALHKALLQRLITDGEHLLSLVRQFGLPESIEKVTPESLAATVDLLKADYRGWHQPMPADRREQLLREVFPEVP
jgi:hypothetical protein